MRINHNISAMNAHRLLGQNNLKGSKTLEKLSSGKRINRAGDDAAGMAISEKMRAQIKGLQTASRNSLDGVSLVQTAEGAMNEIHSMLQRMRELSVQAANGTSAESDREAIQAEINQLTSEVNRIANGTEYNTRNVLKGNEGPDAHALVHRMSTGKPAQATGNVDIKSIEPPLFDLKSEQLSIWVDDEEKVVNLTQTNEKTTLSDFMELVNDALGDSASAVIDKRGQMEITTSSVGGLSNVEIKGSIGAVKLFHSPSRAEIPKAVGAHNEVSIGDVKFTVDAGEENGALANDVNIVFVGAASGSGKAEWTDEKTLTVTLGASGSYTLSGIESIIQSGSTGNTLGFDMSKFTIKNADSTSISLSGIDLNTNPIKTTLKSGVTAEGFVYIGGEELTITTSGSGNDAFDIKFVEQSGLTPSGGKAEWEGNTLTITLLKGKENYKASGIQTLISGAGSGDNGMKGQNINITAKGAGNIDLKKHPIETYSKDKVNNPLKARGTAENATNTSTGTFYFDGVPEVGSKIQVGNETIEFFDSNVAPYVGSNRPIDIAGKENAEAIVDEIVNKFNNGIDGVTISKDSKFEGAGDNARLIITSNEAGFDGNLIYLEGTPKDFTTNLQVGANTGQGFRLEMGDIRAKNLKISADNPSRNPGVKGASYVESAVVTDGISASMVEYAVDVTTEEKASAGIKVFDNAIVQIASERAKLGATQNRLEHTIANLDNTAENLTSAMARIEDTDMALEMSEFQKLNVLQQAGVSMLAQANQQPQSILQLLQ